METFCSEPLQVQDLSVQFTPDFRKRMRRNYQYHFILFLNVPSEAEEEAMTDFVKQHAIVVGDPLYPVKTVQGIDYMTGTRIYRVHSITEHIPRLTNLFGRTNNQPENIQTENKPSRNTEQTKPTEQQNKAKRQVNQHIPKNTNNITRCKHKNKNNNHLDIRIDNSPPEFTTQNYPPLQQNPQKTQDTQQTQEQSQNETIIEETPIKEETPILQQITNTDISLEFLSPTLISSKMTTSTPETINTSTTEIETKITKIPQPTKTYSYNKDILQPQILNKKGKIIPQETMHNVAIKMTEKLAKLSYGDTGFLTNATKDERNQIIVLSMYYQIGRFDPSNTFLKNYSNKEVLKLANMYTEQKLLKTNALVQIYTLTKSKKEWNLLKLNQNHPNQNDNDSNKNETRHDRQRYKTVCFIFKYKWPFC